MSLTNRKLIVLLLGSAAVAVVSGVVAASVFGSGGGDSVLTPQEVREARAGAERVEVARYAPAPGVPNLRVYLERKEGGLICLFDAPDAAHEGGGGCNYANDPFGGKKIMFSLGWDGGPARNSISNARISGIVAADVATVRLEMSDGSTRSVILSDSSPYRAFAYRIKQSDLRAGVEPVAVLAFDAKGAQIDRQTTGLS